MDGSDGLGEPGQTHQFGGGVPGFHGTAHARRRRLCRVLRLEEVKPLTINTGEPPMNDEIDELREGITALQRGHEEHDHRLLALEKVLWAVWETAGLDSGVLAAKLENILAEWEFTRFPPDGQAARMLRDWLERTTMIERLDDPSAAANRQRGKLILHERADVHQSQTTLPRSEGDQARPISRKVDEPPASTTDEDTE